MTTKMNLLLAEQHETDRIPTASYDRRGHNEPTRGDGAPSRWISLAHAALNQAKMAAPRTASATPSSSVACCA
jgi:hypothetical protein